MFASRSLLLAPFRWSMASAAAEHATRMPAAAATRTGGAKPLNSRRLLVSRESLIERDKYDMSFSMRVATHRPYCRAGLRREHHGCLLCDEAMLTVEMT
jgi:hypothetical protein